MAVLNTFTPNTTAKASEVNQNFTNINAQINPEHNNDGTHSIINYTAIKGNNSSVAETATINFDGNTGNLFSVTVSDNRTFTVSNMKVGQTFIIRVLDSGGPRTITWWSNIYWQNGVAPTLVANKVNTFGFIWNF
jgi:hypothetical protein